MSTSIIRLHVFSGISERDPPCYLLQVDDFHCLLDCGWDSNFSDNYVDQVSKYAKMIDAIFLSHSDIRHLGALPYLMGKCGLNCPVFTTFPVAKMGHLTLYDALMNKTTDGLIQKFSLDDVDDAFDKVISLKYQQTKLLHGNGSGIAITPHIAGHTLGGSMWRICKDDNEIIYAMDLNHKKELHLNGAVFDNLPRPQLLILGCYVTLDKQNYQKSKREENLKKLILSTLRNDGSILFLSDTAGRCLEISYLLENLWHNQQSGLMAYGLVFFNMLGVNVIESCQSFIEWMSEKVMQSFEELRTKPFEFRYTRICHTLSDLREIPDPKVIIASQSHLNYGLTQELLLEMANDSKNLVVMTERPRENCVASQLFSKIESNMRSTGPVTLNIPDHTCNDINESHCIAQSQIFNLIDDKKDKDQESELGDESSSSSDSEDESEPDNKKVKRQGGNENESKVGVESNKKSKRVKEEENLITSGGGGNLLLNQKLESGEIGGVHIPAFDIVQQHHHHHYQIRKRLSYPHQDTKVNWDVYGEPINNTDPNYLNTFGSSYAMRELNQELQTNLINSGLNQSLVPNSARVILSQQSINTLSDNISRYVSMDWANKNGTPIKSSEYQNNTLTNGNAELLNAAKLLINKSAVRTKEVVLKCAVTFHNFEGLSDLEALRQVIRRLKPHEVVLVGRGSREVEQSLSQICYESAIGSSTSTGSTTPQQSISQISSTPNMVHIPRRTDEPINLTKEVHLLPARMSDALVTGLKYHRIGQCDLAWVDSIMKYNSENQVDTNLQDSIALRDDAEQDTRPILEPCHQQITDHDTVYINEPKLSDLKQLLNKEGMPAEFNAGILIINNCVAVKRSEAGKLMLEGTISPTYFKVRNLLYKQFAIL